jgi:hypothetical protein
MAAYQMGLTEKAAEWAVKQQKQHHQVSRRAMMSIEAVLDNQTVTIIIYMFTGIPKNFGQSKTSWEKYGNMVNRHIFTC